MSKTNTFIKHTLVEGKGYNNHDNPHDIGCPMCNQYEHILRMICRCSTPYRWTAKRDSGGKMGLYCNNCKKGFTDWTCQDCGEHNPLEKTFGVAKIGGCFVATAAFGDYGSPEVVYLRSFRDAVLAKNAIGREFIKLYYQVGPSLAKVIERSSLFKSGIRNFFLAPLIKLLKHYFRFN